jgi:hypothetical protein
MANCSELIDTWNNQWLVSLSAAYKDERNETWLDAKFSRPTKTMPIPAHFVSVRFKLQEGRPVSYLIECDRTEKKVSVPITDSTLQMHIRIKAKGGARAKDIGLLD